MSNNKQSIVEDLAFWKNNAEENYITTPISVLKYITELEKHIEIIKAQLPSDEEIREERLLQFPDSEYANRANDRLAFYCGAKFVINKLQGGNK